VNVPKATREPTDTQEMILRDWPRGLARTREELSALQISIITLRALERRGLIVKSTRSTVTVWRRPTVDR
jgi:hypothetical protein